MKNAGKYKLDIDKSLVDGIGPIKLGLFPDDVTPKPVIRIVFTLASREAGITFPRARGCELHHPDPISLRSTYGSRDCRRPILSIDAVIDFF